MSVGPYETQTGDNLSHIATEAGMTEDELEAANPDHPIKTWWRRPILWNEAGAIVWIEGYGGGDGGTGTFDGDHVLTGDPLDPPADLAAGQLLWDGVEGGSGGGGAAGPHDHDYLPLEGGVVTGDLQVGTLLFPGQTRMYANTADPDWNGLRGRVNNVEAFDFYDAVYPNRIYRSLHVMAKAGEAGDLQVDGLISGQLGPVPADFWAKHDNGLVFNGSGMIGGSQGSYRQSMTCNGYRNSGGKWTSMAVNGNVGAAALELTPNGHFYVLAASNHPTGSASLPPLRFQVTETGPTFRAMPSQTRSVDDVLERAETAEYPPEDDDGVATMDGHDEVPLFEVVTALLAKVKELSARIEELEGN